MESRHNPQSEDKLSMGHGA